MSLLIQKHIIKSINRMCTHSKNKKDSNASKKVPNTNNTNKKVNITNKKVNNTNNANKKITSANSASKK